MYNFKNYDVVIIMQNIVFFVKKFTRLIRSFINVVIEKFIKLSVSFVWSRTVLNKFYNKLSFSQKGFFHNKFSKIFRGKYHRISNGTWVVFFNDTKIIMPITEENIALYWDSAISIIGHDAEIKETYANLMLEKKCDLFIDIGGNYGGHSLLFLVNKIETLTFEPNNSCHNYFKEICQLNAVSPCLQPIAIGDQRGTVTLSYPSDETWLGSICEKTIETLNKKKNIVVQHVEIKPIDDFMEKMVDKKVVIKIDTEGNELSVLKGANRTLSEIKPLVIFECFKEAQREEIFNFFESKKYAIYKLPFKNVTKKMALTLGEFTISNDSNFFAKT